METLEKKGKGSALLPFLLFIVIYLGAGLYFQSQGVEMAFYQFPSVTAMFIALLLAFCQGKGTIDQKFTIFARGAANENVLTMLIIYILAGAFSTVASAMGGVEATVNLGLSVIPVHFLAAGVFVISAFMGTATGTSMGTISAIVPIAVGVADKSGLSLPLFLGACVGGAMFGDNLSMISDTTIAATRTQGVAMKDKFKANFLMVLPAVIINIVLLFFNSSSTALDESALTWDFIQLIPYILVIVLSLIGINVILAMGAGIAAGLIIGIAQGSFSLAESLTVVGNGIISMEDTAVIAVMVGGLVALMHYLGGIQWLLNSLSRSVKSRSGAELSIAALVTLLDLATTNNTISIITAGPIAKDISQKYGVSPVRAASILDLFSSAGNGVCPWAGQILAASGLAGVSTLSIVPFCWYSIMMFIFGVIFILIGWPKGIVKNTEQAPAAK